ncbi:MAG: hypothetical protein V1887_02130 [Candidatus Aenigmatarchaeota archaeon]
MVTQAEIVHEIAGKIVPPTGKETVYFPKWKGSPAEGHNDYKGNGLVANLDHRQMTLLGQEVSKKVGERYTLLPLQVSYDLVHEDKSFKKMNIDYWLHNREVALEKGEIIADPVVKEVNGELKYDGKRTRAGISKSDVFDTLVNAGLFKKPKKKVWRGSISFENGEASVRSAWTTGEGCFNATAGRPSHWADDGVCALLKTDEKAELPKMCEVAESEYRELLEKSKKYDALMKDLEVVKKHF